jgi:putative alpha-1,2-mannosidase
MKHPMKSRISILCLLSLAVLSLHAQYTTFVDPRIGSEGQGRVFIGPSMPFGMVKPGPDCTSSPNSGWLPMPEVVTGFAQTHVSGTGGGPKYGNVLIQPFMGELEGTTHEQQAQDGKYVIGILRHHFRQ